MDADRLRNHTRNALEIHFRKRGSPRFLLSLIILVTGGFGYAVSYGLLHSGFPLFTLMGVRYPLAVLAAYAVFLVLIRLWVEFERGRVNMNHPKVREGLESPVYTTGLSSENGWLDKIPLRGADVTGPAILPIFMIGGIFGLGIVLITVINAAPAFLAEIYIDVALSSLLYRRLQNVAAEHWFGALLRRTWSAFAWAALFLALIGFALDVKAPEADTMGEALKAFLAR